MQRKQCQIRKTKVRPYTNFYMIKHEEISIFVVFENGDNFIAKIKVYSKYIKKNPIALKKKNVLSMF